MSESKGAGMPGHCTCCARKLNPDKWVMLELDQRIDEYHSHGGVPENQSQGWFEFGSTCANKANKRAMTLLAKL